MSKGTPLEDFVDALSPQADRLWDPLRREMAEWVVEEPIMAGFGETFVHTDEWYTFEESAREVGSHVLATLDESSYTPEAFYQDLRMGDHPIIWLACPGRGRSFYSALGHTAETYARPEHERMLEAAIAWAADRSATCPSGG